LSLPITLRHVARSRVRRSGTAGRELQSPLIGARNMTGYHGFPAKTACFYQRTQIKHYSSFYSFVHTPFFFAHSSWKFTHLPTLSSPDFHTPSTFFTFIFHILFEFFRVIPFALNKLDRHLSTHIFFFFF
jgi:hypothetical protein